MRRASLAVVGFGVIAFALLGGPRPAAGKEEAADPLVVHEWGTFTSVAGADGIGLEGLAHEEESLPEFVYSRTQVRECPLREKGYKGLEVPAEHVTQKMETPVLYFHTKTARRVRVRVDFVNGLISQWYPVSDLLGPPEGPCDGKRLDVSKVGRSFLQWDVDLVPRSLPAPESIPEVAADDPWGFARKVDAAWVRTAPRQGPERMGPVEAEHFLFYRGLGAFTLPFKAAVAEDGTVTFANGSDHQVAQVVAVEVGEGGTFGRYDIRCTVGADGIVKDLLAKRERVPWHEGVDRLKADLAKILRGQGMNDDEAKAMVATWSRSWFSSEGTRLLYVVPRPLVDALLPLRIEPAPAAVERVLLGRIECIPPKTQREVEAALAVLGEARQPGIVVDPARLRAAKDRLLRLGRFEEAHVRRVLATTTNPLAEKAAKDLLRVR